MLLIDDLSTVSVISLSTVGVKNMLSLEGKAIIKASDNQNGFASTLTRWIPGPRGTLSGERYHRFTYTEFVVLPTTGLDFS